MLVELILTLYFHSLYIPLVEGSCSPVLSMMRINEPSFSSGKLTPSQCCDECQSNQIRNQRSAYTYYAHYATSNFECSCMHGTHTLKNSGNSDYGYFYKYYRPLESPTELQVFQQGVLHVVFRTYTTSYGDRVRLYGLDDLDQPTKASGRLYITNKMELIEQGRQIHYHPDTKLDSRVYNHFSNDIVTTLHMFKVDFQVGEVIGDGTKNLSFLLAYKATKFITLNLLRKTVRPATPSKCELHVTIYEVKALNTLILDLRIYPKEDSCSADAQNVTVLVNHDKYLVLDKHKVAYEHFLDPTSVMNSTSGLILTFKRIFVDSAVHLRFYFKPRNDTRTRKFSKFALIITEVRAMLKHYDEWNDFEHVSEFKIHVSNIKTRGAFTIRAVSNGHCMQQWNSMGRSNPIECSSFTYRNGKVIDESEKCMKVDSLLRITFGPCVGSNFITIKNRNLYDESKMKYISFREPYQSIYFDSDAPVTDLVFDYEVTFGLSAEPYISPRKIVDYNSTVSVLSNGSRIIHCSRTSDRNKEAGCFSVELSTMTLKVYPPTLQLTTLVDTMDGSHFGVDGRNQHVRYDEATNTATYVKMDKFKPWQTTAIFSKIYNRSELQYNTGNFSINGEAYQVTYRGIEKSGVVEHYWKREAKCKGVIGKSKETSMRSCMDIKRYCSSANSGWYWLHGSGAPVLRCFCEMETDGGGWLMIVNYTLPDGNYVAVNETGDLNEMFLPGMSPSSVEGFANLEQWYPITQLRFYCFTDLSSMRLHIKTLPERANEMKAFIKGGSTLNACGSFQMFGDDTSWFTKHCDKWSDGKWGIPQKSSTRLYQAVYVRTYVQLNFGQDGTSRCGRTSLKYTFGEWKIFVR